MEEMSFSQTALDQMVCDEQSQLLKAAIPYLSIRNQQIFSVLAKARELRNTISAFSPQTDRMQIQSQTEHVSVLDMLMDIQRFCYGDSKEKLGQAINILSMLQLSEILNDSAERNDSNV